MIHVIKIECFNQVAPAMAVEFNIVLFRPILKDNGSDNRCQRQEDKRVNRKPGRTEKLPDVFGYCFIFFQDICFLNFFPRYSLIPECRLTFMRMAAFMMSRFPIRITFFLARVTPVYNNCRVTTGENLSGMIISTESNSDP